MTSSDTLKQVVSLIERRLKYHYKELGRYTKESRMAKDGSDQYYYSGEQASKELAVCDELEKILKEVKPNSSHS
jgi:hypothetical protein